MTNRRLTKKKKRRKLTMKWSRASGWNEFYRNSKWRRISWRDVFFGFWGFWLDFGLFSSALDANSISYLSIGKFAGSSSKWNFLVFCLSIGKKRWRGVVLKRVLIPFSRDAIQQSYFTKKKLSLNNSQIS